MGYVADGIILALTGSNGMTRNQLASYVGVDARRIGEALSYLPVVKIGKVKPFYFKLSESVILEPEPVVHCDPVLRK